MYFTKLSVQLLYDALIKVQASEKDVCSIHVAPECYDIFIKWIDILQIPESRNNLCGIPIYSNANVKPHLITFICGNRKEQITYDSVKKFMFFNNKAISNTPDVFGLIIRVS